ncbi:hypothetical protein B0T17DRAFT_521306 [Bombardia bombarda]|uniref:Uncharacterized protein n=1 Tax=Bombardia bombarda TaxID=252184 RepID=A0AA39XQ30_9PEZI|nr:hypothetical protein B0T17DRAFT_521306 [Bombardia bombarda]
MVARRYTPWEVNNGRGSAVLEMEDARFQSCSLPADGGSCDCRWLFVGGWCYLRVL